MGVEVGFEGVRKLSEFVDATVYCARKRAACRFKGVARVEHDHGLALSVVALVEPALQGDGVNRRGAAAGGLNRRVVHADDFWFDFHQPLSERLGVWPAFFGCQARETVVAAQPSHKSVNFDGLTCQK